MIPSCLSLAEESKKKKDKKEKDSEKPDTFLEKLIVHLTKNMQVSRHAASEGSCVDRSLTLMLLILIFVVSFYPSNYLIIL